MSDIISSKTGKLIKIGSEEYYKLKNDPLWGKQFTSALSPNEPGITPLHEPRLRRPVSPRLQLPSLSKTSLPSVKSPRLPLPSVRSPRLPLPTVKSSRSPLPYVRSPRLPISPRSSKLPLPKAYPNSPEFPKHKLNPADVSVPIYKVYGGMRPEDRITEILSMPIYDTPSLEEILKRTRQPFLRAKLERMIEHQKEKEGRGSRTRGWAALAPQKGSPRKQLMKECGSKCFLKPNTLGYPICPKCEMGDGNCLCAISEAGVESSFSRSRQHGHEDVAELAKNILEKKFYR